MSTRSTSGRTSTTTRSRKTSALASCSRRPISTRSVGDWDLRIGRQNIIWGEVVGIFVADVVSAQNQLEFILPPFDIIRIPQWAARGEYFFGDSHLELIWIPYPTYNDIGKPGADFYPVQPGSTPAGLLAVFSGRSDTRPQPLQHQLRCTSVHAQERLGRIGVLLFQRGRCADLLPHRAVDPDAHVAISAGSQPDLAGGRHAGESIRIGRVPRRGRLHVGAAIRGYDVDASPTESFPRIPSSTSFRSTSRCRRTSSSTCSCFRTSSSTTTRT